VLGRTILTIGLGGLAAALPATSSAAGASDSSWIDLPAARPLFDLTTIVPGDSNSIMLTVTNPQAFPATFSIAVVGLTDDDNGCVAPEAQMGDTTCGAGGGELQSALRMTLSQVGTDAPATSGTVAAWAARPAIDPVDLRGFEVRFYRLGYELPVSSSNLPQSDQVSFQLELRLDQSSEAATADPPPVVVVASEAPLPGTGTDSQAMIVTASAVTLAGIWLCTLALARRRRRE